MSYDAFISHASEDKDFVEDLAGALAGRGFDIWYALFRLQVGDSLTASISDGLINSRFGIVVLSPSFFGKPWPERELASFIQQEADGRRRILPIWLGVDRDDVTKNAPLLPDLFALPSDGNNGAAIADALASKLSEDLPLPPPPSPGRYRQQRVARELGELGIELAAMDMSDEAIAHWWERAKNSLAEASDVMNKDAMRTTRNYGLQASRRLAAALRVTGPERLEGLAAVAAVIDRAAAEVRTGP